jgi:cytochrome d ubiquinol oxidase subunit I
VSAGNGLFTLLGFMGIYTILSIVFILLVAGIVARGARRPGASPVAAGGPPPEGLSG